MVIGEELAFCIPKKGNLSLIDQLPKNYSFISFDVQSKNDNIKGELNLLNYYPIFKLFNIYVGHNLLEYNTGNIYEYNIDRESIWKLFDLEGFII